jgi:hypothetical protein
MRCLAIGLIFISGCASIVSDKNQPIMVLAVCAGSGEPVPAQCVISNDISSRTVQSPGMVSIPRSNVDLKASCTYKGQTSNPMQFASSIDEKLAGNLVFGGVIGAAIDAGTGSGFNYPKRIQILLDCSK